MPAAAAAVAAQSKPVEADSQKPGTLSRTHAFHCRDIPFIAVVYADNASALPTNVVAASAGGHTVCSLVVVAPHMGLTCPVSDAG